MPAGDRTGPMGQGSRTGRGLGFCSGNFEPGFLNNSPCCGFQRGRGFKNRNFSSAMTSGLRFQKSKEFHFSEKHDINQSDLENMKKYLETLKNEISSLEKKLESFKQEDNKKVEEGK